MEKCYQERINESRHYPSNTMKILAIVFSLVLSGSLLQAQSFVGIWQGTLLGSQDQSIQVASRLTLRQEGNNYLGNLVMWLPNGTEESYGIKAVLVNNILAGTATFPSDNTSYQIECVFQGDKLVVAVGLLTVPVMGGVFTKGQQSVRAPQMKKNEPSAVGSSDGLFRSNRLVGAWAHTRYYGSGEFYGSVRTTLIFYPDGRMASGSSSGNASLGGSSVSSTSDGIQIMEDVRWYSKGAEQIWLRYTGRGAGTDKLFAEYGISSDAQKILLYRNGGKQLYQRVQ